MKVNGPPALQKKLEISNKMLIPILDKVVVNMGFGIVEKDVQKKIVENFATLTGTASCALQGPQEYLKLQVARRYDYRRQGDFAW